MSFWATFPYASRCSSTIQLFCTMTYSFFSTCLLYDAVLALAQNTWGVADVRHVYGQTRSCC